MAKQRVGSIKYQVSKIVKSHNGIGQSKMESRNSSGLKSQNGHPVSDKFHSYKSLDNVRNDLINLGNYAKSKFGIKDMSKIDAEVVKSWVESKDITYNTASNYLSELNKVSEHFNFNKNDIKELRTEFKTQLKENILTSRAYKNLDKIELKDQRADISFKLQRDYGLRVKEATHINLKNLSDNNVLTYKQKGGMISEKEISKELANKIRENAVEGKFSIPYTTYKDNLKNAIESTGQSWHGTHGIRHSYAQNLLEQGYSKAEVSKEMGHTREEITNVYLR
jgi:site-specific recombinase XerD